jgi:hypothetical protein
MSNYDWVEGIGIPKCRMGVNGRRRQRRNASISLNGYKTRKQNNASQKHPPNLSE